MSWDTEVIGISSDSVDSHKSFAEKHNLPFTLLSDKGVRSEGSMVFLTPSVSLLVGVTYVIDQEGIVRHVFSSQIGVERHVREALEALHSMS